MDVHGIGIIAVLSTVGAATGAISAVIIYAICVKQRQLPSLVPGRGPLNWFEKDLLNRAEEATQSSKDTFFASESNITLDLDNKFLTRNNDQLDNEEWQTSHEFNNLTKSLRDAPLPEGTVAASEKCVVVVKSGSITSSHSRDSSTEIETTCHKLSVSSQTCSSHEIRGELQMGLTYDENAGILTVRLIEAHDLRARDLTGTADPYAKLRLLPDRNNVWQTRVHRRTLNPVFDEDFVFEIMPESSLHGRTLEIVLYDFDAFSRHRGLGCIQFPLCSVTNFLNTNLTLITKPILQCGVEGGFSTSTLGELMVSLSYLPSAEKLTVIVVRARNLPSLTDSANADLYVKVKIMYNGKSIKKKKSGIQRETISPVWNDILSFNINNEVLSKCIIEFIILRANGEVLAKCEVSNTCQVEVFQRVLSGRGASAQWLSLSKPKMYCDGFTEQKA